MKKDYIKPDMQVIEMRHTSELLTTSNPDYWTRTPGIGTDEKYLA